METQASLVWHHGTAHVIVAELMGTQKRIPKRAPERLPQGLPMQTVQASLADEQTLLVQVCPPLGMLLHRMV